MESNQRTRIYAPAVLALFSVGVAVTGIIAGWVWIVTAVS